MTKVIQFGAAICGLYLIGIGGVMFYLVPGWLPGCIMVAGLGGFAGVYVARDI